MALGRSVYDPYVYSKNSRLLNGTGSADYIYVEGHDVTVKGGAGNDQIFADTSATRTVLYGENGGDTIVSAASYVTIDGGAGDDFIGSGESTSTYLYISGGKGDDSIVAAAAKNTMKGGAGDDRIVSNGKNALVYGDSGNDYITSNGASAKIYGGAGIDIIESYGSSAKIDGGAGYDLIISMGKKAYVDGGKDADIIAAGYEANGAVSKSSVNTTLHGGAGDDMIVAAGRKMYVYGDAGDDNLIAAMTNITMNGGAGKDTFSVGGDFIEAALESVSSETPPFGYDSSMTVTLTDFSKSDTLAFYGSVSYLKASKTGGNVRLTTPDGKTKVIFSRVSDVNELKNYKVVYGYNSYSTTTTTIGKLVSASKSKSMAKAASAPAETPSASLIADGSAALLGADVISDIYAASGTATADNVFAAKTESLSAMLTAKEKGENGYTALSAILTRKK